MRISLLKNLPDWRAHVAAVEEIFFTSSAVQSFTDDAHRARFKQRWLGRYLDHFPGSFFVALAPTSLYPPPETPLIPPPERGRVGWGSNDSPHGQDRAKAENIIGYLAGCLEQPIGHPLLADLGYYQAFAPLCAAYPCHLHINVAAEARSRGVGAALIEAFAAQCAAANAPGLHLVTNEGARNVRFYEQNGFKVLATTLSHGTPVVFMGREIIRFASS
jgi:GNAT superfamily N-acetyltransferase